MIIKDLINFLKNNNELENKILILTKKIESLDNELKNLQTIQVKYFEEFNRKLENNFINNFTAEIEKTS
jgi:vacuolar-type H+-ATPase subunit I/STV1|tara:strand:+ start:255 stop:461 length:207 start_codon:yes stop_codon:yes gene_type:complete